MKMSYWHDILLDRDFDRAAFASATRDIRTLMRRTEIKVVGPLGQPYSLPIVEDERIEFNGVNQDCVCGIGDYEMGKSCTFECRASFLRSGDAGQAFTMDVRPKQCLKMYSYRDGVLWFDCKTRHKPYDEMVKMCMIVLKYHLGDSIVLHSKGNWAYHWGAGHERPGQTPTRLPGGAVEVYEHVFPERAPVQNILDSESIGF